MYKILFIDEQPDDIDYFQDYVEKTNSREKFVVEAEYPLENINDMVELIFKRNPDAIITDYMLNEYKNAIKYNVPYTGVQLVKEFTAIREGFPCFVMTSFDDDAVKNSEDVNIVYIKGILHGAETQVKASFLDKVETQILHYKSKIQNAEYELLRLLELRSSGKADIVEESEIIRLDNWLELSVDKRSKIPQEYKSLSNTTKLEEILSKVDELLKKINNGK